MPQRIQLSRRKGWRLQEISPGAVKVDRTTKWGNPFKIGSRYVRGYAKNYRALYGIVRDQAHSVELFAEQIRGRYWARLGFGPGEIAQLRGKDLACWCKPGDPCHADILIEIANRPIGTVPND